MKKNQTVSIEVELIKLAIDRHINISAACEQGLKDELGTQQLTPEDKASEGMVKQAEVKERLEREGELENLHEKYFKLDADLREILKEKGREGIVVYMKTRDKFPMASAFIKTPEAIEAQIKRIEYALPLIEKVSLKLPSKKTRRVKKNDKT